MSAHASPREVQRELRAGVMLFGDDPDEWARLIVKLPRRIKEALIDHWAAAARPPQLAPGGDWRLWVIQAGRGFGKTRAGAEWVHSVARLGTEARSALVAASREEAVRVMVEGESGLLATAGAAWRAGVAAEPGRAGLANGRDRHGLFGRSA